MKNFHFLWSVLLQNFTLVKLCITFVNRKEKEENLSVPEKTMSKSSTSFQ